MNVSCPDCRSVFRLDPAKITSLSLRARCSVCGGIIPVGASARWAEDMVGSGMSPAASASASRATPSGVQPVLARAVYADAPPPSPRAPTPAPPRATAPAPAVPAPAARAIEGEPLAATASGPVTSPTPVTAAAHLPAPASTAPLAPAGPTRLATPPTVTPAASPAAVGADPAHRAEGIAATDVGTPNVGTPNVGAPSFGAPLPPPPRTRIPTPAALIPPAAGPGGLAAAFSTPSTPATPAATHPVPRRPINPFLANDPNLKARRLARALVSDMVAYHPTKRDEGLRDGTLKQLFRDEIKKSYEEYVEQVGREFADGTSHFQDALNDILGGGRKIF